MRLIDSITVTRDGNARRIELLVGDLADIPAEHAVDLLVVSAFPDSYVPTHGTLIRALDRRGVRVGALAKDMEQDLRDASSCWLSRPVRRPDLNFDRILCFEPGYRGWEPASTVVGDVFRSLMPFTIDATNVRRIAMPLVATGNQREDPAAMLEATLEAATGWLSIGMPLDVLKIVLYEGRERAHIDRLASVFADFAHRWRAATSEPPVAPAAPTAGAVADRHYDFFISYAREDEQHARALVEKLRLLDPSLRIFLDQSELDTGSAWQSAIYEAIESSHRVVCLYSPDFVNSPVCKEEFNIGMLRHREEGGVLFPAYLRTATLPSYMRLVQYVDLRESDPSKLDRFADQLHGRAQTTGHAPPQSSAATEHAHAHAKTTITMDAATIDDVTRLLRTLVADEFEIRLTVRARKPTDSEESGAV